MALSHAKPGERIHLSDVAARSAGKTAALVKTDAFEAVQLVLRAGDKIAQHAVAGYATVQCLTGSVFVETDQSIEMKIGDWLYLDRAQEHSVCAVQDSTLLLTILFEPRA